MKTPPPPKKNWEKNVHMYVLFKYMYSDELVEEVDFLIFKLDRCWISNFIRKLDYPVQVHSI